MTIVIEEKILQNFKQLVIDYLDLDFPIELIEKSVKEAMTISDIEFSENGTYLDTMTRDSFLSNCCQRAFGMNVPMYGSPKEYKEKFKKESEPYKVK